MRTIFLSLLILATACQPAQPELSLSENKAGTKEDDLFVSFAIHLTISSAMLATSVAGTKREAYAAFVIGAIASFQSADVASVFAEGRGISDLVYHVYLDGEESFLRIKHREVLRHLRKNQEIYQNMGPYEIVEDDGEITDQFLEGILMTWGYHDLRVRDKRDIVTQILKVMNIDRPDVPSESDLEWIGVTDPHVIELNRLMNGIERPRLDSKAKDRKLRRTQILALAESIGSSAIVGKAVLDKRLPYQTALMLLGGVTTMGATWFRERGLKMSPLLEDLMNSGVTVDEEEHAANFAAFRIHFANREVDELYDDQGRVSDVYAQGFLEVWNRNGERWSEARERRVLEQLLVTLRADERDSSDDLVRWGVKDTEFLAMFEAWKKARKASEGE